MSSEKQAARQNRAADATGLSASRTNQDAGIDVKSLSVWLRGRRVGTLALTPDGLAAFEYDASWLDEGFSISPYSLPLRSGVFVPEQMPFDGMFGVFHDSLPDGWGALLLDRMLGRNGFAPEKVGGLARLAIVGSSGRGALEYRPEVVLQKGGDSQDATLEALDDLASDFRDILQEKPSADLDLAYALGGSSGGARPKAYIDVEGQSWIVKFPSGQDAENAGALEYAYACCAQECGIEMSPCRLFDSRRCSGYFGTRRFDCDDQGLGIHMVSASGLLEVSHRVPALDYEHLFQVTSDLTHDLGQTMQLYRLMCFNIFAHNLDDHSNNFSWLCADGAWSLSPAYDLTYSTVFGGEHSTTVRGKGNPDADDLVALGREAGITAHDARDIARSIQGKCAELLAGFGLG
jgi:serine/threonine-protein kinase HipA